MMTTQTAADAGSFDVGSIPLSLYVHYPFCLRKCPYCDFNSYPRSSFKGLVSDRDYTRRLIADLAGSIDLCGRRSFISIFFGGGTPSLLALGEIEKILTAVEPYLQPGAEISLECNPGTLLNLSYLKSLRALGVNRLSLGVQSFQDSSLKRLGRIHDSAQARQACSWALTAGFENINIDIMHGLPGQTPADALYDLKTASQYACHLSWYELTLEEDTYFGAHPPVLPDEDTLAAIEEQGFASLADLGFARYEISAFARLQRHCVHNENYWRFGDYLGIGAGAHSKITTIDAVTRRAQAEHPTDYVAGPSAPWQRVEREALPFEFMLNRLRLLTPTAPSEFSALTGLPFNTVLDKLCTASDKGLLTFYADQKFGLTKLGVLMLNELLELFL